MPRACRVHSERVPTWRVHDEIMIIERCVHSVGHSIMRCGHLANEMNLRTASTLDMLCRRISDIQLLRFMFVRTCGGTKT